jgi:hypothetical protein
MLSALLIMACSPTRSRVMFPSPSLTRPLLFGSSRLERPAQAVNSATASGVRTSQITIQTPCGSSIAKSPRALSRPPAMSLAMVAGRARLPLLIFFTGLAPSCPSRRHGGSRLLLPAPHHRRGLAGGQDRQDHHPDGARRLLRRLPELLRASPGPVGTSSPLRPPVYMDTLLPSVVCLCRLIASL